MALLLYQSQGIEWAVQGLKIRQEVGYVMEEMLDVIEVSTTTQRPYLSEDRLGPLWPASK